jgi:hypothetical protein
MATAGVSIELKVMIMDKATIELLARRAGQDKALAAAQLQSPFRFAAWDRSQRETRRSVDLLRTPPAKGVIFTGGSSRN